VSAGWWFGFVVYQFNTIATDGFWTGLLRPLIAADASDSTTNRLLSFLTGGQAGFTGASENLDAGPPWEWAATFFRTFWVVGIEEQQPLGLVGVGVALGLCLLAALGLSIVWRRAGEQRLILGLLLLHFGLAFVLPLIRYAATLSLADTAQGRHVLFLAGPAFAILLVWGFSAIVERAAGLLSRYNSAFKFQNSGLTGYIPAFFLLFWSGSQLWTMSWAYYPPLPVRTLPAEQIDMPAHSEPYPLNEFVTLLGHENQLDSETGMLTVKLWWEAMAVSPVDYLTELTLVDAQGVTQAQWLGYPASGRYPTRAWDAGDIVRDTAWLPMSGLEPGAYKLRLQLRATTLVEAREPVPNNPVMLAEVRLVETINPVLTGQFPLGGSSGAYTLWQEGRPLTQLHRFRYRETILATLTPPAAGQERSMTLVGPNGSETMAGQTFSPVWESETEALFIVGPDWPTGDYQLAMTGSGQKQEEARTAPLFSVINRWERNFDEPPLERRLEVNFANQVKLLGYDLGANRAEPGGGIPLTLYWQGLDWMGQDYTIFTKLLAADQTVHGGRDRLPREGYRTLYWAPGEIVTDPFGVPVEIDAPDGIYYLNVGLYKLVEGQAYSLPLVQDGQPLEASSIDIGPIKIGQGPAGVTLENATPQVRLNQPFGDDPNLTLLGYDLTDETGRPLPSPVSGQSVQALKLKLYWRSESILTIDYTTFVHVRNEAGEIAAQKDQPPLQGAYPTSLWEPGEIIADEIIIPLPPGLSGVYTLAVGLYDLRTGVRLAVAAERDNSLSLGQVELR
jgi:hypothetical protein